MFHPVRAASRAMLSAIYLSGGLAQVQHPEGYHEQMADQLVKQVGLEGKVPDAKTLVRANGAGMLAAGAGMALGILPRTSALGLAALTVPTTLTAHAFWKETDPAQKQQQQVEFFKNLGLIGGLLAVGTARK